VVARRSLDVEPPSGDDGGTWLFDELDGKPETNLAFATAYYEIPVSLDAVMHVFQHRPLNDAVVRALNADLHMKDFIDDIRSIGYPQ